MTIQGAPAIPRNRPPGSGGSRNGSGSGSEVRRIYISRATANKDEDLKALAIYLQDLTEKYKKEPPSF